MREGLPKDVTVEQLKKALLVPELVWNAVVMEKNPSRRPGQLPTLLLSTLKNDVPEKARATSELMLKFWVNRKDLLFADYQWPLVVEVYQNLKKDVIIRINVHGPESLREHFPKEWNEKKGAEIISIQKK